MSKIEPFFKGSHGVPWVDDRRVVSDIVSVLKHGLQGKDAPRGYGPHKTLYNRFQQWTQLGVFDNLQPFGSFWRTTRYADNRCNPLKGSPHRVEPLKRGILPHHIGRTKGGLNIKLHAVCDGEGRPIAMCLTAGQVSDHIGAKTLYPVLPDRGKTTMITDKGYDLDAYCAALKAKGIMPCIPPRRGRNQPAVFCKTKYKQRHKIENRFGRLKD